MEVIYRACDGKEFASEEACRDYEKKNITFKMYGLHGEPVYSTHEAMLVNLCHPNGGADFSGFCDREDSLSDGIGADTKPGWYWWNKVCYVLVNDKMITALLNAGYFQQ